MSLADLHALALGGDIVVSIAHQLGFEFTKPHSIAEHELDKRDFTIKCDGRVSDQSIAKAIKAAAPNHGLHAREYGGCDCLTLSEEGSSTGECIFLVVSNYSNTSGRILLMLKGTKL